ncbi:Aft1 HRA domain-containing protein [Geopyxis carbonaria]|nr:Aft1 HRA domain-containing protein [Geopyxis carbonaria]
MSAAVSTMQHQPGGVSNPASRMATSSPIDSKKSIKTEDSTTRATKNYSTKNTSNPAQPTIQVAAGVDGGTNQASQGNSTGDQQNGQPQNEEGTPGDYFSLPRPNRLDQEPNPFERSFAPGNNTNGGDNNGETPKAILPPVTAMTSPALPLGGSGYNWGPHSLRSGPLSPAMLQGPTGASGGLGFEHIRSGLTPNESGIRSGLTPGGSGSMFPAPSPSTSNLFFGVGGATPGTMEFQKTALSAARKSHPPPLMQPQPQDVNPDDSNGGNHVNHKESHGHKRQPSDSFNTGPEHNAANGLFMLAQLGGAPNTYQPQGPHIASGIQTNGPGGSMESSPTLAKRAAVNNAQSVNIANRNMSSSIPNSVRGMSEMSNDRSGSSQEPEPMSGRKSRNTKGKGAGTGKRKNEEVIGNGNKPPSNKKSKPSRSMSDDMDDEMMDDMDDDQGDGLRKDGKKMTDEEKRKNFLERNRVAALKCRQRKKQWLANLQAKVELYGSENDALNATVQALREEIVSLKTLLLAHKDCPVARANGVQLDMASMAAGGAEYGHVPMMQSQYPGMMQTSVMHQQQAADRRFS